MLGLLAQHDEDAFEFLKQAIILDSGRVKTCGYTKTRIPKLGWLQAAFILEALGLSGRIEGRKHLLDENEN